jgi:hypothetical protein
LLKTRKNKIEEEGNENKREREKERSRMGKKRNLKFWRDDHIDC